MIKKFFIGMNKYNYLLIASVLALCACNSNSTNTQDPIAMTNSLIDDFKIVSQSRIYFGHQSVGGNIVNGIKDLQKYTDDMEITFLELGDATEYPASFLIHSEVGENTKPLSKCEDFQRIINHQLNGLIKYAMLKFCYIDIDEESDVDSIFNFYRNTMDTLITEHPDITFIHITAPLRHSESGVGIWVRELLGKPNRSKMANIKRNLFNEMLRSEYSGDPMFDLAASESTYPDGRRSTFNYKGGTYNNLIREYTYDGGHLNELGRTKVATDLIHSLASIIAMTASSTPVIQSIPVVGFPNNENEEVPK